MKRFVALLVSVAAVATATGLIYALRPVAPDLSLGVVYVLPVMLVAIAYGMAFAIGTAVVSMLAFNFLFLPPLYSSAAGRRKLARLGVYLGISHRGRDLATSREDGPPIAEQRSARRR